MLGYGLWDGDPAVMNGRAWYFDGERWIRANNPPFVIREARALSREEFQRMFFHVPPLPTNAFQVGDMDEMASD